MGNHKNRALYLASRNNKASLMAHCCCDEADAQYLIAVASKLSFACRNQDATAMEKFLGMFETRIDMLHPTTLAEYNASLSFDSENLTWCLFGTTSDGLGWETEDFPAASLEEAEAAAINYLVAYNS